MSGIPPLQSGRRPIRPAEADIFRECSRCRHPMRRWAELRNLRPGRAMPQLDLHALPRRRNAPLVWGTFHLVGILMDEIDVRLRRFKHQRLEGRARNNDWVCPNCLHRETPDDHRLR